MLSALLKRVETRNTAEVPKLSSEPMEGNPLFEAMVCEFHWTALQIGAITASMNAALALNRTWMLRSCVNLVPVQAPVIALALRSWKDMGFSRDLAAKIGRVYFDLAEAKKVAVPLISSAGSFGRPTLALSKLEQIAAVWRKLCEDCNEAVQQLEPETRWRLSGLYTGNTLILGKFLKEAIAGNYGCVNTLGEATLPVLPQRRRTQRYTLFQPCRISLPGQAFVGLAREISKNGMSLECDRELQLRDPVTIELRSGRKIKGVVVWSKQKKLGIQFENPLADGDPILTAA